MNHQREFYVVIERDEDGNPEDVSEFVGIEKVSI